MGAGREAYRRSGRAEVSQLLAEAPLAREDLPDYSVGGGGGKGKGKKKNKGQTFRLTGGHADATLAFIDNVVHDGQGAAARSAGHWGSGTGTIGNGHSLSETEKSIMEGWARPRGDEE